MTSKAKSTLTTIFFLLMCFPLACFAVDSVSFEVGSGNDTQVVRISTQWQWKRQWWESNGTHLGGYWDLSLAQWRGNRFQDNPDRTQNITDIGITPVFRFQRDTLKGLYAEAAIGVHYLSEHYDNAGRQMSTNFQFGDHIGFGYVFQNGLDLGLRVQHFSNGGIREPNDGVNFAFIRLSYRF